MLSGYKTIIGIIIAAVPTVATFFGYETSSDFEGQATEMLAGLLTIGGLCFALYGRLKATVPGWFAKSSDSL